MATDDDDDDDDDMCDEPLSGKPRRAVSHIPGCSGLPLKMMSSCKVYSYRKWLELKWLRMMMMMMICVTSLFHYTYNARISSFLTGIMKY